jgi:hypothetical protein
MSSSGGGVLSSERMDGHREGFVEATFTVAVGLRVCLKTGKKMTAQKKGNNRNDKSV